MGNIMPSKSIYTPEHLAVQLQTIGQQIKNTRKSLKLSAALVAESAGMSRTTLHRIEKGETSITMGSYLVAMDVVGLQLAVKDKSAAAEPNTAETVLPVTIKLVDYPGFRQLAWQLSADAQITPKELAALYERNHRHLDSQLLSKQELDLLQRVVGVIDAV